MTEASSADASRACNDALSVSSLKCSFLPELLSTGLVAMGLFCALGTLCFYIAVKHTSAANVSQYHYTQLVTGTLVSYLIWRDKPGLYVLLGGTLILASGLYIAVTARQMLPLTGSPVE